MQPTTQTTRHDAARKAARARWGPKRIVRRSEVDADTWRLITALLAQQDAERRDQAA